MGWPPLRVADIRRGARRTGSFRSATPISSSSRSSTTEVASRSAFGQWIASATPGRILGWAVRTDSIDAVARRLGQPVVPGSRVTPSGALISWSSVGADIAVREPGLPFFIQWRDGEPLPGATAVRHRGGPITLRRLSVAVDQERLADWLGDHDLPIAVTGQSGISALTLTASTRGLHGRVTIANADRRR